LAAASCGSAAGGSWSDIWLASAASACSRPGGAGGRIAGGRGPWSAGERQEQRGGGRGACAPAAWRAAAPGWRARRRRRCCGAAARRCAGALLRAPIRPGRRSGGSAELAHHRAARGSRAIAGAAGTGLLLLLPRASAGLSCFGAEATGWCGCRGTLHANVMYYCHAASALHQVQFQTVTLPILLPFIIRLQAALYSFKTIATIPRSVSLIVLCAHSTTARATRRSRSAAADAGAHQCLADSLVNSAGGCTTPGSRQNAIGRRAGLYPQGIPIRWPSFQRPRPHAHHKPAASPHPPVLHRLRAARRDAEGAPQGLQRPPMGFQLASRAALRAQPPAPRAGPAPAPHRLRTTRLALRTERRRMPPARRRASRLCSHGAAPGARGLGAGDRGEPEAGGTAAPERRQRARDAPAALRAARGRHGPGPAADRALPVGRREAERGPRHQRGPPVRSRSGGGQLEAAWSCAVQCSALGRGGARALQWPVAGVWRQPCVARAAKAGSSRQPLLRLPRKRRRACAAAARQGSQATCQQRRGRAAPWRPL
jgi:hypothetical protein